MTLFAWNFADRGLVPDTGAGSWLLPRLIGPSRALRLLYTGEFLSAEAARELAGAILRGSPFSHARMKQLVYEGLGSSVAEHMARHTRALAECFRSHDHREGVAAFLERRDANFTGS
jgi:enoyl-CoA hydratase/carnithine racemase